MNRHYLFCSACNQAFQVPPNYRQSSTPPCPGCKKPLELRQRPALSKTPHPSDKTPMPPQWETQPPPDDTDKTPRANPHLTRDTSTAPVANLIRSLRQGVYQVMGILGEGGWGRVYQVRDPVLKRPIALKVLVKQKGSENIKKRFFREILITSHLEHPNITPVYEGGSLEDGSPYYIMKEIRGKIFKDLLRPGDDGNRQKSLRELLEIFLKVCDGVAYAHSKGIIHRDLKPANIAVGAFGEVIVMDWGLAKKIRDAEESWEEEAMAETMSGEGLSMAGDMIGTPAYMPPEQANGHFDLVGIRSDVYSLGAILYEILTLTPPYLGKTREILTSLLMKPPDQPRKRSPHLFIPRPLEAIALKAMYKEVEGRYNSLVEMVGDLQKYLEDKDVSVYIPPLLERASRFLKRHSLALMVVSIILFLVAVFGYLLAMENEKLFVTERKKEKLTRDKLRAEKMARQEKEKKLQYIKKLAEAQEKIIRAQKEREREMQLRIKAYGPYFMAVDALQRNMRFSTLKSVVIPHLKKALAIQPKFIEPRWELIKVYIYMGRDKALIIELMNFMRLLSMDKNNKKFSAILFRAMMNPKALGQDKEELKKMDLYRPEFLPFPVWTALKVLFLHHAGQNKIALEEINKLQKLPEGKNWDTYLLKVTVLKKMGRTEEALEVLHEMVHQYPHVVYSYLGRAHIYTVLNKLDLAFEDFAKVASLDPSNHILWYELAYLINQKRKTETPGSARYLADLFAPLRYLEKTRELEKNYVVVEKNLRKIHRSLMSYFKKQSMDFFKSPSFLHWVFQRAEKSSHWDLKKEFAFLVLTKKNDLSENSPLHQKARQYLMEYRKKFPRSVDRIWIDEALGK